MSAPGPLVTLVRHGETEWSQTGRHTGRTDVGLTSRGEAQAKDISAVIDVSDFDRVLVSPMHRAQRTADLAGLQGYEVDDDLREWDYGRFEGMTSAQIHDELPGWSIWDGPWDGGETAAQVAARADRVLDRALGAAAGSRLALVGHGHFSRVLGARWVGAPVAVGRWLALDTAAVCDLGWEHDYRVLRRWNLVAGATMGE